MDALALLRLQVEWGADEALDPDPPDRLVPAARPADTGPAPARVVAPLPRPSAASTATPAERAVAAAGQADTLEALRAAIAAFDGCALRDTATNLVFAAGDPAAGMLLVGEPPGAEEDRSGTPFAGREGALLDRMLASTGLDRAALLLTPLIPWRPPGGRPPHAGELATCLPFLHRLIALAGPRRLVILGGLATRALLPGASNRRRASPAWTPCAIPGLAEPVPALALPGLAALLKTPALRREAWAGLRLLRRTLDGEFTEN